MMLFLEQKLEGLCNCWAALEAFSAFLDIVYELSSSSEPIYNYLIYTLFIISCNAVILKNIKITI